MSLTDEVSIENVNALLVDEKMIGRTNGERLRVQLFQNGNQSGFSCTMKRANGEEMVEGDAHLNRVNLA